MRLDNVSLEVKDYIRDLEKKHEQKNKKIKQLQDYQIKYQEYHFKYLEMKERYDLLVYKRYMRSAEHLPVDKNQNLLFVEELKEAEAIKTKEDPRETKVIITEVSAYTRKKPGRKAIDPSIPREEKIIDIPENDKTCTCGEKRTKIGEESNEKLHIIPPRIYVEKTIRLKYACRRCEGTEEHGPTIKIAPVEPSLIPKGVASSSLLSHIMVHKYEDHLPYYRQEKQFERIGVHISRHDMANWQQQVYKRLSPLFTLLEESIKSGPVIQMDETTVQVMGEEDRKDTQKSYMWLARGGPPKKKVILYHCRETRASSHAHMLLEGYQGYLQTDGYSGYDAAVKELDGIVHVGCFAHAPRKFFEASKATKKSLSAEEGIKFIRKLYAIEDELRKQPMDDEIFVMERKKRSEPILAELKSWLLKRSIEVPPTMLLGKVIEYSLSQWSKMILYLESPYLTPDNNACENAIRPFVIGRKNWLFNKSPEGAESSCGMFSLIENVKQNDIVPLRYLTYLFEKAPMAKALEDWEKLLPWIIFTA